MKDHKNEKIKHMFEYGWRIKNIADKLEMKPSTVKARMQKMRKEGIVIKRII